MTDATDSEPTSAEMEPPGEADDDGLSKDEVTEVTPPNTEEGDEAPEAGAAPG